MFDIQYGKFVKKGSILVKPILRAVGATQMLLTGQQYSDVITNNTKITEEKLTKYIIKNKIIIRVGCKEIGLDNICSSLHRHSDDDPIISFLSSRLISHFRDLIEKFGTSAEDLFVLFIIAKLTHEFSHIIQYALDKKSMEKNCHGEYISPAISDGNTHFVDFGNFVERKLFGGICCLRSVLVGLDSDEMDEMVLFESEPDMKMLVHGKIANVSCLSAVVNSTNVKIKTGKAFALTKKRKAVDDVSSSAAKKIKSVSPKSIGSSMCQRSAGRARGILPQKGKGMARITGRDPNLVGYVFGQGEHFARF